MNLDHRMILYVDDDADDQEMLLDAIGKIAPQLRVDVAKNGLEALEYLEVAKEKNDFPCLIVLDLNMPYLGGRETYEQIKKDPKLCSLPVIVFSSGNNPSDKVVFEGAGVEYFNKPLQYSLLPGIVRHMLSKCS
jgi:CheY-like chemotaxis protein